MLGFKPRIPKELDPLIGVVVGSSLGLGIWTLAIYAVTGVWWFR